MWVDTTVPCTCHSLLHCTWRLKSIASLTDKPPVIRLQVYLNLDLYVYQNWRKKKKTKTKKSNILIVNIYVHQSDLLPSLTCVVRCTWWGLLEPCGFFFSNLCHMWPQCNTCADRNKANKGLDRISCDPSNIIWVSKQTTSVIQPVSCSLTSY